MNQSRTINPVLDSWNGLEPNAAAEAILPCNGSYTWAVRVANKRPFDRLEQLFAACDEVWRELPENDWQQAFDSHPRIGEHRAKAASQQSAAWSKDEQSEAQLTSTTETDLAKANKAYEAKFGRIFIVCASGKTATEMLAILLQRIQSDVVTELQEAAEQQRRITQLRLRKWLQLPAAKCEEV